MGFKAGYDCDGVLAQQPPDCWPAWKNMNGEQRQKKREWLLTWYKSAPRLLIPPEERFVVITARKCTPEVREVTLAWLAAQLPGKKFELEMLSVSRSIENVVAFKYGVIKRYGLTDYTEDNTKVVKLLRQMDHNCRIWHYKNGVQSLDQRGSQLLTTP